MIFLEWVFNLKMQLKIKTEEKIDGSHSIHAAIQKIQQINTF